MTIQQRRTANASSSQTVLSNNGHPPKTRPQRTPIIKRQRKIVYESDFEEDLQLCLCLTLLLLFGVYALWKLSGGGVSLEFFKPKPLYDIPHSMKFIGEKSQRYQLLRKEIDELYPEDAERSRQAVKNLHNRTYQPIPIPEPELSYDVHNCPDEPPPNYPYAWPIMEVLRHWPPDDPTPPAENKVHQGLCIFDFERDFDKAMTYRTQELPFVVRGDPSVAATVERWNAGDYMERLMDKVPHRTEYSPNNHFMYWMNPSPLLPKHPVRDQRHPHAPPRIEAPPNWTKPTEMMRMPYKEWFEHANVTDDKLGPDNPHWYYRLIGCGAMQQGHCDKGSSEYLFDELTFFQPRDSSESNNLYLVDPNQQKGIHCRFGMKGVIAENHFDGSRNTIVVLGGERRYILSHPDQCPLLSLFPNEHPSARHSMVDWSDVDLETFPNFPQAKTNEVVLQAGDVLYLPTNWFHYIVSLDLNFQCNTRSGMSMEYMPPMKECGFF
mmetsp:Transcript_12883/g.19967  ORF Transcript_12883/g.19967 Transcript_12883/m.19967 type:complete len:493 (+) Transcript_12883:76-1554(+)